MQDYINNMIREITVLRERHESAARYTPDFFEPGMIAHPEQWDGSFDPQTGRAVIRFESRGTRYDGRTEQIETVHVGDPLEIVRDWENPYNSNNFMIYTRHGQDVGNLPAELCNAIAPLWDRQLLRLEEAKVSFVEPISHRSRHARQAVLFVELTLTLLSR